VFSIHRNALTFETMNINPIAHNIVEIIFTNLTRGNQEFTSELCSMECSILIDLIILCTREATRNLNLPVVAVMTYDPVHYEVLNLPGS
jgi:hypothetical protein